MVGRTCARGGTHFVLHIEKFGDAALLPRTIWNTVIFMLRASWFIFIGLFLWSYLASASDSEGAPSTLVVFNVGGTNITAGECESSDVLLQLISNCGWGWGDYSMRISNPSIGTAVNLHHAGEASSFCVRATVPGAYSFEIKSSDPNDYVTARDEKEVRAWQFLCFWQLFRHIVV